MDNEIVVSVDVDELTEIVSDMNTTMTEQIVPQLDMATRTLLSINTSVTLVNVVLLGVFIYEYCKRIFKKKSVK